MRVPLGWLREWLPLPGTTELAERLTASGFEVEAIERTGPDLSRLRVGHVLERGPHPNADRLSLCRVDLGGDDPAEIVCGAPNVAAGQKVAVASPGETLPDGTKLKKAKIRGVVSQGMICSARELGLGDEHEGILVLDPEASVGESLDRVLEVGDTVVEIAVLPNRGDCTSLLGVAREVRAYFGGELSLPECAPHEVDRAASDDVRIAIEAPDACHAYAARVVRNVRSGPSPDWLVRRLEALGLRPINVVVDVTNLVLHEFGQPLHAFDLDMIRGSLVRVRRASAREPLVTLDGAERRLEPEDLVIADAERAIALAGVMGGANTEVGEGTRHVLLESAHFHPACIRHSARRLGLFTDASYRFERGVDAEGVQRAADRAARLLAELAGGEVSRGHVEARGDPPERPGAIRLVPERVNRLLGTDLSGDVVRKALERVDVSVEAQSDALVCRAPSHRNDLWRVEDLVEEVARIHGYDAIEATLPALPLVPGSLPPAWDLCDRVRDALEAEGLVEVQSLPFIDPRDLERVGLPEDDPRRRVLRVLKPVVESESHLRSTLVPSFLGIAHENLSRQLDRVAIFEVCRTFQVRKASELPEERLTVAVLLAESERCGPWEPREPVPLFFRAKGVAERLLTRLGYAASFQAEAGEPHLHPGAACRVAVQKQDLGWLGVLHPGVAATFDVTVPCVLFELDLERLLSLPAPERRYQEVSAYPRVRRDLAVLLPEEQPAGEVLEAIRRRGGQELTQLEIFDRYAGKGVPEGKISLAFRLTFQSSDRTLTDDEVTRRIEQVVDMLAKRFHGTLRH
jgi:phenylalanyl-tRNA synthetase beta chain